MALLTYLALARPGAALSGLLAAVPAAAGAAIGCYHAELLSTDRPTGPGAVEQGQDVALIIAVCVLAAILLRFLLLRADRRLAAVEWTPLGRRRMRIAAAGAAAVALLAAVAFFDAAGYVSRQADRFVEGTQVTREGDLRGRLTEVGNNGRLDLWRVARDDFRDQPLRGTGAGTYEISWARERNTGLKVQDAHSLFLESLSELGLVGGILIVATVLALLAGGLLALRAERLAVYGAVVAATVAWTLEAGLDWIWEMPVTGLWLFALGGMCLARSSPREHGRPPARFARVLVGVGVLALVTTPALMALSQRQLDASVQAFKAGDCNGAISSSLSAIELLSVRPEPYLVLGLCDARLGQDALAVLAMRRAVALDREGWRGHYGLALAQASAGRDPRAAAREARRLNPRSPLTTDAVERFDTAQPSKWKRRAAGARLFESLGD